jgi:hypothetical protein
MRWLNSFGLPTPMVHAIKWTDRPASFGDKTVSVTTLLKPTQARHLEKVHDAEIETDVSDHLWRLLGQAVHVVLERAAKEEDGEVAEKRYYWPINGWRLTGQIDILEGDVLSDYKLTKVYSVILPKKPEWEAQLNMQRWLLEMNGKRVNRLQIVAMLKDHSAARVGEPGYPEKDVRVVPIKMWTMEETEAFIAKRLDEHIKMVEVGLFPPCTSEERWERPGKFAVMQKGKKRAVNNGLKDTEEDAASFIKNAGPAANLYIQKRPSLQIRCDPKYCGGAPFCSQRKELMSESQES